MKLIKSIIAIMAALGATVGYAGDSAPFRLDTMEGTRVARAEEVITYSTEWDNAGKVIVAVDGVTLKEASAPASGDVTLNVAQAGLGNHTLTHTAYKNGVADKVETVTFTVKAIYTVTFDANGGVLGSGEATRPVMEGTAVGTLPTPTRTGYAFAGWWTAATGGVQVSASTKVTSSVTYYAHWTANSGAVYTIRFHKNDGSDDATAEQVVDSGVATRLTSLAKLGWAKRGIDFVGWGKYPNSTVVWKSNWANVTDLADEGEKVDLYAMWAVKPDGYAIEFIRNDGAGTWRTVGFNYGEKTRMPSVAKGLGWARRGYDFMGWELTTSDANDNTRAAPWKGDWAYVATPTAKGSVLTIYARWKLKAGYYQIRFNKNDGTGKWRSLGFECDKSTKLSTIAGLGWERPGYTFKGWASNAANAAAGKVWKTDGEWIKNATAEGRTLSIYAIWE